MSDSAWVTVDIKVRKEATNEADPWYPPRAWVVAQEVRERLEGIDLDTGWVIEKVSASTLSAGVQ